MSGFFTADPTAAQPELLTADDPDVVAMFATGPQWGIFTLDGSQGIIADSVIGVDLRQEWRIATAPIEEGGFASYNKVALPYGAKVILVSADSDANRGLLLDQVAAACASTDLFAVLTPEFVYPQANLTGYSYQRTAERGLKLLRVEVQVEEVRIVAPSQLTKGTPAITNPQNPGAASPVNMGTVALQPAPASLTSKGNSAGGSDAVLA